MPNYQNGKIYKLVSPSGLTYIGSTTQSLAVRKGGHKAHFLQYKSNKRHYITSFKLFEEDIDNIDIVLVEEVKCENKEQLYKRERYYVENIECVNKIIPSRTKTEYRKEYYIENKDKQKEYQTDNKERIQEYRKKYNDDNKEKLKKLRKEHYNDNKEKLKECQKEYYNNNKDKFKERQKEYYNDNKEKKQQYFKRYHQQNKEKISKKHKEKITCECGTITTKSHLLRHQRTKLHTDLLEKADFLPEN